MKIRLVIATDDSDYAEHLSRVLINKYESTFEVSICSVEAQWEEILSGGRCDVALLAPAFADSYNLQQVRLPLFLYDGSDMEGANTANLKIIKKYQRISSMAGSILEYYSQFSSSTAVLGESRAHITTVWSPAGGTGKTTVALAYAARKASDGKHVTYLNLETFCSTPAFFQIPKNDNKSISTVFARLESDVSMLAKGILQQDSGSGIAYFCGPDNYDDINILTEADIDILIRSCTVDTEELVIDLSAQCDSKTQKVFELADTILIVSDPSPITQAKILQFVGQHNIAQRIRKKSVLVNNKGAQTVLEGFHRSVQLPQVRTMDIISVYKTLSGTTFEW